MHRGLALICVAAISLPLTGCGSAENPAEPMIRPNLSLSHGMQICSHLSGGVAGLNETVQVSEDWKLVATGSEHNFVRPLDGAEQQELRQLMKRFATMDTSQSPGSSVSDGIAASLVARGTGSGLASKNDVEALQELLTELARRRD